MQKENERLKRLSAQGMNLEELIRCVMSADPKPLWKEEKKERERKQSKNKALKKQKRTKS